MGPRPPPNNYGVIIVICIIRSVYFLFLYLNRMSDSLKSGCVDLFKIGLFKKIKIGIHLMSIW